MLKCRIMLASTLVIAGLGACASMYVRNQIPQDLREHVSIYTYLLSSENLSRFGITATTPARESGIDNLGNHYFVYLDKQNIPITVTCAQEGLIFNQLVGQTTKDEIIRLAKLIYGEDVICEVPQMYEDTIEVKIHGEIYTYENGTLERVSREVP